MPFRFEQEKRSRIAAVKRRFAGDPDRQDLQRFADALFAHGAAEDVAAYSAETLAEMARAAWSFFRRREDDKPQVRLTDWPAADRQGRAATVVEILGANRPFILDSTLGELQAAGHRIRLVLHPIFEVERDAAGRLLSFAPSRRGIKSERPRESFVHVHVAQVPPAGHEELTSRLVSLMEEVRLVTDDWRPMRQRLRQAIRDWRAEAPPVAADLLEESLAFLDWLEDDNFTFLGMREFSYSGLEDGVLVDEGNNGLGILRDPKVKVLRRGRELVTMTPEIRAFLTSPEPLIVTKANVTARVHRRDYMDYVGVKMFAGGEVVGELRIVGLFTSSAYTRSVQRIPFIRLKVSRILERAGFDPVSHSGKTLINILEKYPRTELYQADEGTLFESALAILQLAERPRVRALSRRDRFDRFVSVLVFVPRERYSSDVRERIGEALTEMYDGRIAANFPAFPDQNLARVHFIVGRNPGEGPDPGQAEVEERIRGIVRTWADDFADALNEAFTLERCNKLFERYHDAFGSDYRAVFTAREAIEDIRTAEALAEAAIAARFFRRPQMEASQVALRFHHLGEPIPLSERVPLLENMGFFVVNERTFRVSPAGGPRIYVHEMTLTSRLAEPIDLETAAARLQAAILAVWTGLAENDGFNMLVAAAGLDWRQAALMRTVGRYLRQAQIPYSLDYQWTVLCRHAGIARRIFDLFAARFDPDVSGRERKEIAARRRLEEALEEVTSLDDDTILRDFVEVVEAAQRTDFYTLDPDGRPPPAITLKLKPAALAFLAPPRPFREIFVHSPQVEGVHMRFGPVARGGLRWSDRPQDYRVEVLGLGKAQQVKNAVIVPVGAKGGFVPQALPEGASREAAFEAGRQAYVGFVDRLLAVTDNLDGDRVVPPPRVVRHDGDDPYLVVAADKGTATFSDTANAVAAKRGFWLDDAFASGGSAGYDHKAMGITARGAWEAVKRHFREMDKDIQAEPFTVAGVGDMSGDVFGNGMLLSRQIRLLAAFDHRDIFIDPDPDPARSWAERRRLFDLPRSSWQDYDGKALSKGGGVWSRRAKEVPLSPEARRLLGIRKEAPRPNEVIGAILRLPVELMWFGGIGTYVRASTESNAEVGDKANDAVRITAGELAAKVVGEGANLAMTQRGRIEYGLKGGRSNSDAIDNSGGVNSSDLEVNIKIALAPALRAGRLDLGGRNALLKEMTEEVAELVLRNNYQQSLAISLETARGLDNLAHQGRLMDELETRGLLDRQVETLPDAVALAERQAAREPLTRAEVGVLLAYAKIALFDDLVASTVPDDEYLRRELFRYFPGRMRDSFHDDIAAHRLRREIIATQLSNSLVNRAGPTVLVRLRDRTGATSAAATRAYTAVRDSFSLQELNAGIDALDCKIGGEAQLALYTSVQDVLVDRLGWFVRNIDLTRGIGAVVDHYRGCLGAIAETMPAILPDDVARRLREEESRLKGIGVPAELAQRLARLPVVADATDVVLIADRTGRKLAEAARAYYAVAERFGFGRIEAMVRAVETADYYEALALDKARDGLAVAHRQLSESVLAARRGAPDIKGWERAFGREVAATAAQIEAILSDGRPTTAKATVAASLLAELASQRAERAA
jgi:glutamate dehydrogenase